MHHPPMMAQDWKCNLYRCASLVVKNWGGATIRWGVVISPDGGGMLNTIYWKLKWSTNRKHMKWRWVEVLRILKKI